MMADKRNALRLSRASRDDQSAVIKARACSISTNSSGISIGMKQPNELTVSESFGSSTGTLDLPDQNAPGSEELTIPPVALKLSKTALAQIVLIVLGTNAALYFARPVLLPIFLACVAGMTLKPLIRWSSYCHIPPATS